jgi:hypothetical protein
MVSMKSMDFMCGIFCVSMNSAVELFRGLLSSLSCIYQNCVQFCVFEHWRLKVEVLMRNF